MSYFVFTFVIALLVFEDHILVGKADNECADGYEKHEDSCYYLSMPRGATATRAEAVAACKPGHLADITSEGEQDYIVKLLTENGRGDAWFGLLKSLSWSDGSSLMHEPWQNILADGGHQCFLLEYKQFPMFAGYIWNDIECSTDKSYRSICEYEISNSEECRQSFTKFNRSCYQINDITLNRTDAIAACNTSQAHLVDINSNEEHQSVVKLLTAAGGGDAWFGLTLSDPPSWSDGSLLSPASWYDIITDGFSVCYRLQDNNGPREFCQSSKKYCWNDSPSSLCGDKYRYVCEYEVISATTMTTVAISNTPNMSLETSTTDANIGAIVGSLFGVALIIVAITAVIWFVLRQRKRNRPESQSPGKVPSVSAGTTREPEHNNPTYAIDGEATTEDDAHQYNTVHNQQGEYTYIELNASAKDDEHFYAETAADRKSSHTSNKDLPDEGWKDNTIYVTSDETPPTQNAEEGWADNSVYGK